MNNHSNIRTFGFERKRLVETLDSLYQKINNIDINLRKIESLSGDEFVKYGSLLNRNHSNIKNIIKNTQAAVDFISSQNLSNNIKNLEGIIDELSESIDVAKKHLVQSEDTILKVENNIDLICDRISDFNSFIKRLSMVGLSTKIESARIGITNNGFDNLAGSVENLSNKINEKVKSILHESKGLSKIIKKISIKTSQLLDQNNNIEVNAFQKIKENISFFSKKIIEAGKDSEKISNYSNQISDTLSSLISSFQYQDITKQQIDHICFALKDIEKIKGEEIVASPELVSTNYNICSIQYAQIQNTKEEFLNATGDMIAKLKAIGEMMNNLQRMNFELLDINDEKNKFFISQIEKEIENVSSMLVLNSKGVDEIIDLVCEVKDTVETLSVFVSEVEDVDEDIELISMNAQIKAARLGEEGAALGVLAQNIQKLSNNTKLETESITNSFEYVNSQSNLLNKQLTIGSEKLNQLSKDSVKEELDNIFSELGEIENSMIKNMENTNSTISELQSNFLKTEELVDFNNHSENSFDEVIFELKQILTGFNIYPGLAAKSNEHVSKLKQNYTMKSERDIHDSINDNGAKRLVIKRDPKSGEDFGDNVDLF